MKTKEQKNNVLTYKGYYGSIELSLEDNCLFGSLIGLENGAMTYEGDTITKLKDQFEETVDIYLEHCRECGIEPQKPFCHTTDIKQKCRAVSTSRVSVFSSSTR